MSHTTRFKDHDGGEWAIIHNSDYSGMAQVVSPEGKSFEVPACVMCLQMEAWKERMAELNEDFGLAPQMRLGEPVTTVRVVTKL